MGVRVSVVPLFAAAMFNNGAAVAGFALAAYAFGTAVVLQVSGRMACTQVQLPDHQPHSSGTAIVRDLSELSRVKAQGELHPGFCGISDPFCAASGRQCA